MSRQGVELLGPGAPIGGGLSRLAECDGLSLFASRGQGGAFFRAPPSGEAVVLHLSGTARHGTMTLGAGDALVLGPGASLSLSLGPDGALFVAMTEGGEASAGRGPTREPIYQVERGEVLRAMEPRGKVKVVEGELWRPEASPGRWRSGTEILGRRLALSFFRGGVSERLHRHQRSWEAYCVLEGALAVDHRGGDGAPFERVEAGPGTIIAVPPEIEHLVDESSRHMTAVVQCPPGSFD